MTVEELVEVYKVPYLAQKGSDRIYTLSSSVLLSKRDISRGNDYIPYGMVEEDDGSIYIQVLGMYPVLYTEPRNIDLQRSLDIPINRLMIKIYEMENDV